MKNIFVKNYASLCGAFFQENKNSAGDLLIRHKAICMEHLARIKLATQLYTFAEEAC